jgi:hypothetical protein
MKQNGLAFPFSKPGERLRVPSPYVCIESIISRSSNVSSKLGQVARMTHRSRSLERYDDQPNHEHGPKCKLVVPSLHIPVTKTKIPNFYFKFLSRSLFSGSGLGSHGSCDCGVEFLLVESDEYRAIARYRERRER